MTDRTKARRRARMEGYTIVELLVSVVLFLACLLGVLNALTDSMYHYSVQGTYGVMQMDARRALEVIARDLRMAGRIRSEDNLIEYPYTFVNGGPTETFTPPAAHPPATQHLDANAPGFGDNREVGYKIPADNDGDGFPTSAATGLVEWSPNDISFVVVTDASGINQLQRWEGNVCTDIIANYAERITFDTVRTDPTIDWNEVVVTVYMARPTPRGVWLQTQLSTIVKMRNTDEAAEPATAWEANESLLTYEALNP